MDEVNLTIPERLCWKAVKDGYAAGDRRILEIYDKSMTTIQAIKLTAQTNYQQKRT